MSEVKEVEVQEVFGQFAVVIGGEVSMFASKAEALTEYAKTAHMEEYLARGNAFGASLGLSDKAAKGKSNTVVAFLAWEAAGSPEYVAPVEAPVDPAEVEADTDLDSDTDF